MCGRFEFKTKKDDLEKIFRKHIGNLHIDYDIDEVLKEENIAPTNRIRVIVLDKGEYKVRVLKWAIRTRIFDPSKKGKEGVDPFIEKDMFNNRIETLKKSAKWKKLLEDHRCLVPMSAFYEWQNKGGPKKEPQRITIDKEKMFFAGGIIQPSDERGEEGASIITCEPNTFMKPIHNRMPVLFEVKKAEDFLTAPKDVVASLCEPLDNSEAMVLEKAKI
jgi:putative SOS response-associated peptidase YedK